MHSLLPSKPAQQHPSRQRLLTQRAADLSPVVWQLCAGVVGQPESVQILEVHQPLQLHQISDLQALQSPVVRLSTCPECLQH